VGEDKVMTYVVEVENPELEALLSPFLKDQQQWQSYCISLVKERSGKND